MTDEGEQMASLATVIELPVEMKEQLEEMCARRGIAMRDYVENLVRAAFAGGAVASGQAAMARAGKAPHSRFEEVQHCKYGCNYATTSKSGLTQHEKHCTRQSSNRGQGTLIDAERKRQVGKAEIEATVRLA